MAAPALAGSVAVPDALGRNVTVHTPVRRVVTLNKNAAEIMRILGVQDRITGVSRWMHRSRAYWPELDHAPYVGMFDDPNLETVAAVQPDLILAYGQSPGQELEGKMAAFGAQVLRLDLHQYSTFHRDLMSLARIFGRVERARAFMDWERGWFERIRGCVNASRTRTTAYLESYGAYHAMGPGSSAHERCELAGGVNAGRDLDVPRAQVTPEWILARDPDVIIKYGSMASVYAEDSPELVAEARREVLERPGLQMTRAVREGRVYVLNADIHTGPRSVVAVAHLARWLHPDACAGLDPVAIHREFMDRFQGVPYRGVFATPAEAP
jgi:iron complex transport system substrate-binding protein